MILQSVVPSKRRRKKKEAAHLHLRLKEKEEDEVEKDHGLQDQIPALRTRALEAKVPREKQSRYVVKIWKASGTCKYGDKCKFWHAPPCRFHAKGSCKAGNACPYPHRTCTATPAKTDKPSAGLALGLPAISHSQSRDFAGGGRLLRQKCRRRPLRLDCEGRPWQKDRFS